MLTQCPHCNTLFRVTTEQLEVAEGQVRCCRCQEVFSALEQMQEEEVDGLPTPQEKEVDGVTTPQEETSTIIADGAIDDDPAVAIDVAGETADDNASPPTETSGNLETGSLPGEEDARLNQVDLAPFLTHPKRRVEEIEPSTSAHNNEGGLPFTLPDSLGEIPVAETATISADEIGAGSNSSHWATLGWSMAIILLLLILLVQLGWFGKAHLMKYPEGRQLLELACSHLDCQLPVEKSTRDINITSRSIISHPDIENALLVSIRFINKADHPQPYPALQLSFFGDNEQLAVQRVFEPAQYLHRPTDRKHLFQPDEEVDLQLELQDPGKETTGFMLEFL